MTFLAPVPASAQDADDNIFHHGDDLPWGEANDGVQMVTLYGDPSAEGPFAFRLRVTGDFEIAPHSHPVTEHMTVLSGRFFVGLGDTVDRDAAQEYGPGSYIAIGAGVLAYMWTEGPTVVQIHGTGPFTTDFPQSPGEPPYQP